MDTKQSLALTKKACYVTNVSMSAVICLSPLLFVTFRETYGISYTLLGLLVAINFSTQLLVDLIFTFFSKRFNIDATVRLMPFITFFGLLVYGALPALFPESAYLWIVTGTVLFSVSAGLNEVLTSPIIAAIPSKNPEKEMSKLHSSYAWGVVGVVVISTLFLKIFGADNWQFLAALWSLLPFSAFLMFQKAALPQLEASDDGRKKEKVPKKGVFLCFLCIFFGGATECTMTQWASSFIESAVGIPKLWGDILGVAAFAFLLGCGRTLYTKYGKNITRIMLLGMTGAVICYILASVCLNPVVGLCACVVTGICVSMLWPGTIICVGEKLPGAGVAVYALMAAGGDTGGSVAPQLVGIVSDKIAQSGFGVELAARFNVTAEQAGMRAGLLLSTAFPVIGVVVILCLTRSFAKKSGIESE